MKNLIKYGFIAVVSCFYSCTTTEIITQEEAQRRIEIKSRDFENTFEILILDGCEYYHQGYSSTAKGKLTHKGNCKNPIHKCNCN